MAKHRSKAQKKRKNGNTGRKRQLLVGTYDVLDPTGSGNVIGRALVKGRPDTGPFDNTEHWAFLASYSGSGINEVLGVRRRTAGEPTDAQWQDFLTFLRADRNNIYIVADCTQRAHPA